MRNTSKMRKQKWMTLLLLAAVSFCMVSCAKLPGPDGNVPESADIGEDSDAVRPDERNASAGAAKTPEQADSGRGETMPDGGAFSAETAETGLSQAAAGTDGTQTAEKILVNLSLVKENAAKITPADDPRSLSDGTVYSYRKMEADLKTLAQENADIAELFSLGQTVDGREIYAFRIGRKNASKNYLVTGAIHAREYITTELVVQQMTAYLANIRRGAEYQGHRYADWAENAAVYFVPMINPDGVSISQFGPEGLQKDTTKELVKHITALDADSGSDVYYRHWKSNAEGIDINRQFDALWDQYDDHLGHPSADHYKGTAPGTTAEAKALIAFTQQVPLEKTISYHTAGRVIYWYFGQSGELYDRTLAFASALSQTTGYPLDGDDKKLDPAGYKDWAISRMGIPSVTIEVGSGDSPLDSAQLAGIYRENQYVLEEMLLTD